MTADHPVLAVDIGGSKLAVGIVTPGGELRARATTPTPRTDDPEELWSTLAALIDGIMVDGIMVDEAPARLGAVGVGCGGPMDRGGEHVSPLNIGAWREFPLRARLADHTGLATFVDNDAKALALGEGWVGAARGMQHYIAMVVSTGVGGGIVLDGRLLDGADGNAGHIGHVIVVPDGRTCGCGARGCLEAEASGTAIAAITGRPPHEAPPAVVERTGTLVGRAIASVANLLDVDLAVVAGSVALGFGDAFFRAAQAELDASCRLDFSRGMRVAPAGLGDAGPLVGAAAVAYAALGFAFA